MALEQGEALEKARPKSRAGGALLTQGGGLPGSIFSTPTWG